MTDPVGAEQGLELLISRRSVSPKRLVAPAPDAGALARMLEAALRAPDHARLTPWRVIEFGAAEREALARLFEAEKRRRAPLASDEEMARAREHAHRAPMLLAFVVRLQAHPDVPHREQWMAAGAALGNLLNAAHALGYGAIMLSGERCFDAALAQALGLAPEEAIAGFVSIGTIAKMPAPAEKLPVEAVWSVWRPETERSAER